MVPQVMITRVAARRAEDVALDIHRKNFPFHQVTHWDDIGAHTSGGGWYPYDSSTRGKIAGI